MLERKHYIHITFKLTPLLHITSWKSKEGRWKYCVIRIQVILYVQGMLFHTKKCFNNKLRWKTTLQFEENIQSVLFASPSSHHWLQLRMMKNIFKLKENPFWFLHIVLKKRNLLNLFFTRILLSRSSLKSMQLLDWSND